MLTYRISRLKQSSHRAISPLDSVIWAKSACSLRVVPTLVRRLYCNFELKVNHCATKLNATAEYPRNLPCCPFPADIHFVVASRHFQTTEHTIWVGIRLPGNKRVNEDHVDFVRTSHNANNSQSRTALWAAFTPLSRLLCSVVESWKPGDEI